MKTRATFNGKLELRLAPTRMFAINFLARVEES